MASCITDLPDDLLFILLDLSRPDDFNQLALTCRKLNEAASRLRARHNACRQRLDSLSVELRTDGKKLHRINNGIHLLEWLAESRRSCWVDQLRYLKHVIYGSCGENLKFGRATGSRSFGAVLEDNQMAKMLTRLYGHITKLNGIPMIATPLQDKPMEIPASPGDPHFKVFDIYHHGIVVLGTLSNLQTLVLSSAHALRKTEVESLSALTEESRSFPRLKTLEIYGCDGISLTVASRLMRILPLSSLVLENNTRAGFREYRDIILPDTFIMSHLTRLSLRCLPWECRSINNLFEKLPKLRCFVWVDLGVHLSEDEAYEVMDRIEEIDSQKIGERQCCVANESPLGPDGTEEIDLFRPGHMVDKLAETHGNVLTQLSIGQRDARGIFSNVCHHHKIQSLLGFHCLTRLEIQLDLLRPKNIYDDLTSSLVDILRRSLQCLAIRTWWSCFAAALDLIWNLTDGVSGFGSLHLVKCCGYTTYGERVTEGKDAVEKKADDMQKRLDDRGVRLKWLRTSRQEFDLGTML